MRDLINKLSNIFVKPLLKSPLHGLMSNEFMHVTFTGRKSGKEYSTPVQYRYDGDSVLFVTNKNRLWWRNLKSGTPITLRVKGKTIEGHPEVFMDRFTTRQALERLGANLKPEQLEQLLPDTVMVRVCLPPEIETIKIGSKAEK